MVERLGVIADVHGNALALEAVLRDAGQRGVERFVDLGDTLYGPLWPLATYDLFVNAPIVAGIAGNQDRKIAQASAADYQSQRILTFVIDELGPAQVAWLRGLPPTVVVDGEVFLCHGTPSSDTTYLLEDVSDGYPVVRREAEIVELLEGVREPVILCGHSHIPRVVRLTNGQLIVNPGSVGLPAYDDNQPVPHAMENYSPHASYGILEKSPAGWAVALHRVIYDWNGAGRRARNLEAEDWALGLETGRMSRFTGRKLATHLREHRCVP